jgi:hypothetical protein
MKRQIVSLLRYSLWPFSCQHWQIFAASKGGRYAPAVFQVRRAPMHRPEGTISRGTIGTKSEMKRLRGCVKILE